MRHLKILQVLALSFLLISYVKSTSYTGYKVYQIIPETFEQTLFLHQLVDDSKYDFWKEGRIVGRPSQVMVAPEDQLNFEEKIIKNNINYEIVIPDVARLIQQERIERSMTRNFLGNGDVTFNNFMFYSEHMAYLRRLAQDYPNIATLETIGQSHEGRDILLLRISSGPSQTSTPKPTIFIDAGIHCREWIAPPVALYIIHQLVENSTNVAFYANVDWAIVPNLNPDGYEYTQSTNRLWRKNRRLAAGNNCYGTDLNRNFGYQWMFAGASNDSCSDIYAGTEAFSEPEAQAIRDWFLQNKDNVRLYLTFHSYGEMILYPWGYIAEYPENSEELQLLGDLAGKAIDEASTIGSSYYVNNSAIALYATAGASDDWVKAEAGVELSYTVELPLGDAPYAFMIPARQISPVVQETWVGVQIFHNYIEEKFWTNVSQVQPRIHKNL